MAIPLTGLLSVATVEQPDFDLHQAVADLHSHRPVLVPTLADARAVLAAFGQSPEDIERVLRRSPL